MEDRDHHIHCRKFSNPTYEIKIYSCICAVSEFSGGKNGNLKKGNIPYIN
jgi:hypothetical protein